MEVDEEYSWGVTNEKDSKCADAVEIICGAPPKQEERDADFNGMMFGGKGRSL